MRRAKGEGCQAAGAERACRCIATTAGIATAGGCIASFGTPSDLRWWCSSLFFGRILKSKFPLLTGLTLLRGLFRRGNRSVGSLTAEIGVMRMLLRLDWFLNMSSVLVPQFRRGGIKRVTSAISADYPQPAAEEGNARVQRVLFESHFPQITTMQH